MNRTPAGKAPAADSAVIGSLLQRVLLLESRPTFGRDFRIGMFVLGLAFVAIAGHWALSVVGYLAMKDAIFRKD